MVSFRTASRAILASGFFGIMALQLFVFTQPKLLDVSTGIPFWKFLLLGALAALYGGGKKVCDLFEEHGLTVTFSTKILSYLSSMVGSMGLMFMHQQGCNLMMADLLFHGVIKGKADTRNHLISALFFMCLFALGGYLHGTEWGVVFGLSLMHTCWSTLHKFFRWTDNLWNQVRAYSIFTLMALSLLSPQRFTVLAWIVSVEHISYAMVKAFAMSQVWYADEKACAIHVQAETDFVVPLKNEKQWVCSFKDIGGYLWLTVYMEYIYLGLRDGTIAWPLAVSATNIAWEFIYSVCVGQKQRYLHNYFFALVHLFLIPFVAKTTPQLIEYAIWFAATLAVCKILKNHRKFKYFLSMAINISAPLLIASRTTQCGDSLSNHVLKVAANFCYAWAISHGDTTPSLPAMKVCCFLLCATELYSLASFLLMPACTVEPFSEFSFVTKFLLWRPV